MAAETKIEWCHHTFNPWRGCTKVHTGCANCYAERDSKRFPKLRGKWGADGTRVRASDDAWREPVRWNAAAKKAGERRRVFCASLADVFEDWPGPIVDHEEHQLFLVRGSQPGDTQRYLPVAPEWRNAGGRPSIAATMADMRRDLFRLIDKTPWLDWLLVTKRPENIRRFWAPTQWGGRCASFPDCDHPDCVAGRFRENVWALASVSDQETFGRLYPPLFECSDLVPVVGLSAEPLLGPINFEAFLLEQFLGMPRRWIIVGGESGRNARPCNVSWISQGVEQCHAAGEPAFVKQFGDYPLVTAGDRFVDWAKSRQHITRPVEYRGKLLGAVIEVRLNAPKGGDPAEWPEELRVREYPQGKAVAA